MLRMRLSPPNGLQRPSGRGRIAVIRVHSLHKAWQRTGSGGGAGGAGASAAAGEAAAAHAGRAPPLTEPDAATLEFLTIIRDPRNAGQLAPFLPAPGLLEAPPAPVVVAGVPVVESGPLAGCSEFIDAAARRVLPGHLLRRSRILSSLRVGGGCLQRVAVTACSGEEVALSWRLQQVALDEEEEGGPAEGGGASSSGISSSSGSSSSSGGSSGGGEGVGKNADGRTDIATSSGRAGESGQQTGEAAGLAQTAWRVVSIARDASGDADGLPTRPHPRVPPERAALALLAALRRGQPHEAARFAVWGRHASSGAWDAQMQEFRALLRRPDYHCLLTHDAAELGPGALPAGQRSFLQEVTLRTGSGAGGGGGSGSSRFLFLLNMHADGCWLVRSFEAR